MTFLIIAIILIAIIYLVKNNSPTNNYHSIKELTSICNGDTAQVKRLISAEQKRNGSLDYEQAADAAIKSFKRDNR